MSESGAGMLDGPRRAPCGPHKWPRGSRGVRGPFDMAYAGSQARTERVWRRYGVCETFATRLKTPSESHLNHSPRLLDKGLPSPARIGVLLLLLEPRKLVLFEPRDRREVSATGVLNELFAALLALAA